MILALGNWVCIYLLLHQTTHLIVVIIIAAAEKKTSKRPAAMKIDEVEARLKEKDPTATIRLQKGSTIVPDLLSADSMVSKALEKAAAVTSTSSPAAPNRESQINIVDSDEAVGLENMLAGIVSTDLVLAINPGNSNLHTDLSVLDSSCMEEDYADEFFIIKSLRSACAITERLLDKKRHLKNELNEERFRVTELEARNKELVDQLEKEKHQLTLLVQTYQARATQAEVPNSDLLLALNNLLERYGTLDKQHYKKLEQLEEYVAKESNAGHGVKVAMSEHNDSVNKEEEEGEEDKQRKKARLDNKDKVAVMFLSP
nr:hypothetical protein Iba_chr08dCG8860 [Ipomoea batatas]